jgi:hypothetical protein
MLFIQVVEHSKVGRLFLESRKQVSFGGMLVCRKHVVGMFSLGCMLWICSLCRMHVVVGMVSLSDACCGYVQSLKNVMGMFGLPCACCVYVRSSGCKLWVCSVYQKHVMGMLSLLDACCGYVECVGCMLLWVCPVSRMHVVGMFSLGCMLWEISVCRMHVVVVMFSLG